MPEISHITYKDSNRVTLTALYQFKPFVINIGIFLIQDISLHVAARYDCEKFGLEIYFFNFKMSGRSDIADKTSLA